MRRKEVIGKGEQYAESGRSRHRCPFCLSNFIFICVFLSADPYASASPTNVSFVFHLSGQSAFLICVDQLI